LWEGAVGDVEVVIAAGGEDGWDDDVGKGAGVAAFLTDDFRTGSDWYWLSNAIT
jgi:hypothetical protein